MTNDTDKEPVDPGTLGKDVEEEIGMYAQFKTDAILETKGVEIDYGTHRVTIARAGGANKKYARVLEQKTKPYRRAIATETLPDDRGMELLQETYAEAIILNWETKVNGKFVRGIEPPPGEDSKLLPVTPANIVMTFKKLPELFIDLQTQAGRVAIFREIILEDDAGN